MSLPEWPTKEIDTPCATERDSWSCKNMLEVKGDLSMTHEHYSCAVCERRIALDYDEMR